MSKPIGKDKHFLLRNAMREKEATKEKQNYKSTKYESQEMTMNWSVLKDTDPQRNSSYLAVAVTCQ